MTLRVTYSYKGTERVREFDQKTVLLGRPTESEAPDLDLSPDIYVSRRHAMLCMDYGLCWVKDVGSKFGTKVNGREIKELGDWPVWSEDVVVVGETTVRAEILLAKNRAQSPVQGPGSGISEMETVVRIVHTQSGDASSAGAMNGAAATMDKRLGLLCDLPMKFSVEPKLDALYPLVVDRIVQAIPGARRAAVLLRGREGDALLLKAYVSADAPAVSETLARRALTEGRGFIWRRDFQGELSNSVRQLHLETGMYAPLQWQGRALGVLCVDSPEASAVFTSDDLRLLMAVAQYLAMALANQQMYEESRHHARLLDRLLTSFSPKLREVLLDRASHGRLRPGGDKSEVTLLFCDICGFTSIASGMDTGDVADMLNDYFPALAQAIFQWDGTIDKFVGDAVLAVFGSPEPDAQQQEKAVRAAWAMQAVMQDVNQRRASCGEVTCRIRIGVHCGEVFHGFIGAAERLEYTVVGDAVNKASRYCYHAQASEILISPEVYQRVFNLVQAEKSTIAPKEGEWVAYRVKALRG